MCLQLSQGSCPAQGRSHQTLDVHCIMQSMQPVGYHHVVLPPTHACSQPLPDADVCFQRFKDSTKLPPNNSAMASSPNGKEVVRYIKVGWSTSNDFNAALKA